MLGGRSIRSSTYLLFMKLIKQDLNAFDPFLIHYGYKSGAFLIKKQYI